MGNPMTDRVALDVCLDLTGRNCANVHSSLSEARLLERYVPAHQIILGLSRSLCLQV
jgi:hypothetical protein